MKRIILTIAVMIAAFCANAQCTPGAQSVPGADGYLLPDSATNLKHACAGQPYSETIYIMAFRDTSAFGLTGVTDSFVINVDPLAIGLPSYLSLATVPATLPANSKNNFPHVLIKGDSLACVKITGTVPAGTSAGTTGLNINFNSYLKLYVAGFYVRDTALGATYSSYKFIVDPPGTGACALAINDLENSLKDLKLVPNPINNYGSIQFLFDKTEPVTISVKNTTGVEVYQNKFTTKTGINSININTATLSSGVYIYTLTDNKGLQVSRKFIKE